MALPAFVSQADKLPTAAIESPAAAVFWRKEATELNYDFALKYGEIITCNNLENTFIPKTNDVWIDPINDRPELHYKAPVEDV